MTEFTRQKVYAQLPPALVHKWSEEILDEGFVAFPKRLLRSLHTLQLPGDKVLALQVILAVVDYDRPDLTRWPSVEFLAFLCGRAKEDVLNCLNLLKEAGLVCMQHDAERVLVDLTPLKRRISIESMDV